MAALAILNVLIQWCCLYLSAQFEIFEVQIRVEQFKFYGTGTGTGGYFDFFQF